MNILYLNPISYAGYNQAFANSLKNYKYGTTHLDVASLQVTKDLPETLNELGYRVYESLIINPTTQVARLGSLATVPKRYDAMVIGCFYDPALIESRTISGNMHVIGPCQASCQIAANLGNTFSIIIGMDYWEDQMRNTVYDYGYKEQLISFENINIPASQLPVNPNKTLNAIVQAASNAVQKGAEVIILGCTLETGTYLQVEEYLEAALKKRIPVIDPSIAALKAAEHMAMNSFWNLSRVHGMEAPSEEDLAKYQIFQTAYKLANIVSV